MQERYGIRRVDGIRSQMKMLDKVMKQKKKTIHSIDERLPTYTLTNILDDENGLNNG